jgi:plastin-1
LTDDKILEWGNNRVPQEFQVASFKDPAIRKGHFFFELLKSIEPRAIDQEYVQPGDNAEEMENNAKYVISVARRLGATVFLIWEQIRDVFHHPYSLGKSQDVGSLRCFTHEF